MALMKAVHLAASMAYLLAGPLDTMSVDLWVASMAILTVDHLVVWRDCSMAWLLVGLLDSYLVVQLAE